MAVTLLRERKNVVEGEKKADAHGHDSSRLAKSVGLDEMVVSGRVREREKKEKKERRASHLPHLSAEGSVSPSTCHEQFIIHTPSRCAKKKCCVYYNGNSVHAPTG